MSDMFEATFPEYLSPIISELTKQYKFVEDIGRGKNGQTYKIKTLSSGHCYCLKTISPNIKEESERKRIGKTLIKEVEILKPLSHRCLPTIYEHNLDEKFPYYVSTFHTGITLAKFQKEKKTLKFGEAVFVIQSLIDVLEYIHTKGRTHCDLHKNNILLSDKIFAEGLMIIDFGSGHRDSDDEYKTRDGGNFGFKNVKGQAGFRQPVNRNIAKQEFQNYDFRAFGNALALMANCFFANVSHDQLIAYNEFCGLLENGYFNEWDKVREHFDHVIDPNLFMSNTEKFFVMKDGSQHSILIPASDPIPVGEAVLSVINTNIFQRLRTIKQLSFCEWAFPGGTHSRFEHSLGVFCVTRKALSFLSRDPNFKARYNQNNINSTLLAALIHDLGHYPFAHVIEHYISARYSEDKPLRDKIHHSKHVLALLDTDTELQNAIDKSWGEEMREETKRVLENIIPPLSEILDGAIDCDKLDYLRRDAHHCGVSYGNGLDIISILRSLRCSPDTNNHKILVDSSMVPAIEGFMIAQDQMLTAVYWHKCVRAVFAMFHRFLDGVLHGDANKLVNLVEKLKRQPSEHDAFQKVIIPLLDSQKPEIKKHLYALIKLHIEPNYKDIYKQIVKYSALDDVNPNIPQMHLNIYNMIMHKPPHSKATSALINWNFVKILRDCYRQAFREKNVILGHFDILVDVPWGKALNRVITVIDEDKKEHPITEVSHLPESIFITPIAYSAPIRVYIPPSIFERCEPMLNSIKISAEERFYQSNKNVNVNDE